MDRYPIWLLFAEAEFVAARHNQQAALYANLTQLAVASAQGNKKATKKLNDKLEKLSGS